MVSDKRWREFLEHVEWRTAVILREAVAYEGGEISAVDMCIGVRETASKLLEDVQEHLRPGSRRR